MEFVKQLKNSTKKKIIFFDIDNTIFYKDYKTFAKKIKIEENFNVVLITSRYKKELLNIWKYIIVLKPNFVCLGDGAIYKVNKNKLNIFYPNYSTNKILINKINLTDYKFINLQPKYRQSNYRAACIIHKNNFANLNKLLNRYKKKFYFNYFPKNMNYLYFDVWKKKFGKYDQVNKIVKLLKIQKKKILYFGDGYDDFNCRNLVGSFYLLKSSNSAVLKYNSEMKKSFKNVFKINNKSSDIINKCISFKF